MKKGDNLDWPSVSIKPTDLEDAPSMGMDQARRDSVRIGSITSF
jgi:hypothetical protein